jgi:hypothetical protein
MAKALLLNTNDVEYSFFEESALIAVQSQLSPTQFCYQISKNLGLPFKRIVGLEAEIKLQGKTDNLYNLSGTLFDAIPMESEVHFPIYEYVMPFSENRIYLYNNIQDHQYMVPEYKDFRYLFLLQDTCFTLQQRDFTFWLKQLNCVQHCAVVDPSTLGKSKENLIM